MQQAVAARDVALRRVVIEVAGAYCAGPLRDALQAHLRTLAIIAGLADELTTVAARSPAAGDTLNAIRELIAAEKKAASVLPEPAGLLLQALITDPDADLSA